MLINISNHPSAKWGEAQIKTAKKEFGGIIDIPFPKIPTGKITFGNFVPKVLTEYDVEIFIDEYFDKEKDVFHLMGEQSFSHYLGNRLFLNGFSVCVSTTERIVEEKDGKKISKFTFKGFRFLENPYKLLFKIENKKIKIKVK